jgi:hypothetical protein
MDGKGKMTSFWDCKVTKMPFVEEKKNQIKKKRSLNAVTPSSSKYGSLLRGFFAGQLEVVQRILL